MDKWHRTWIDSHVAKKPQSPHCKDFPVLENQTLQTDTGDWLVNAK